MTQLDEKMVELLLKPVRAAQFCAPETFGSGKSV